MTSSFPVKLFILPGEVEYLFLSLNELGKMSQTSIEFGNFEDKNPYWLIIFETGFHCWIPCWIKEMLHVNTYSKCNQQWNKSKKNTFSLVSLADVE